LVKVPEERVKLEVVFVNFQFEIKETVTIPPLGVWVPGFTVWGDGDGVRENAVEHLDGQMENRRMASALGNVRMGLGIVAVRKVTRCHYTK
jgi:hypothetical protein